MQKAKRQLKTSEYVSKQVDLMGVAVDDLVVDWKSMRGQTRDSDDAVGSISRERHRRCLPAARLDALALCLVEHFNSLDNNNHHVSLLPLYKSHCYDMIRCWPLGPTRLDQKTTTTSPDSKTYSADQHASTSKTPPHSCPKSHKCSNN
jgi:hypothetical protein